MNDPLEEEKASRDVSVKYKNGNAEREAKTAKVTL